MTSIGLKDASFPVLIHTDHQKNLSSYLITCVNLHACQMDVDLL